jgi:hypothetical protein
MQIRFKMKDLSYIGVEKVQSKARESASLSSINVDELFLCETDKPRSGGVLPLPKPIFENWESY